MSDQVKTKTEGGRTHGPGHTEPIYSICQVSELLGVAPIEVVQWLKNGWLPCRQKPNEPIRISQSQLVIFLRNRGIDLEAILAKAVLKESRQARPESPAGVYTPTPPITKPVAAYREALALTGQSQAQMPSAGEPEPELQAEPDDQSDAIELESSPIINDAPVPAAVPMCEAPATPVQSAKVAGQPASAAEKILIDAVRLRATAVHLEIADGAPGLALRIDGAMCRRAIGSPAITGEELARQFKSLLAAPAGGAATQAGKFSLTCSGLKVDFSLFACPTTRGQKIVIGISDPREAEETSTLNLCAADERAIGALLAQPAGIIIVTGQPRGGRAEVLRTFAGRIMKASPKGTISASAVVGPSATPSPQIMEIPGASCVRFDPSGGPSCAQAIGNCASLDADLIVVENLQDPPALAAAAGAAGQGRLILAGMGEASAARALAILREMNLGDWPLAGVLLGVVAVASVRRLCPHCKQRHEPSAATLNAQGFGDQTLHFPLYLAKGCDKCANTGYAGTIPLVSILKVSRPIAAMIRLSQPVEAIEQSAGAMGFRTIRQAAMELLSSGVTSLSQVALACPPEL